jgi:hypothetical protein
MLTTLGWMSVAVQSLLTPPRPEVCWKWTVVGHAHGGVG